MTRFVLLLIVPMILVGCGKGGTAYYPKNHLVALYSEPGGRTTFLNWGDKLLSRNLVVTNTNKAGQMTVYLGVQNAIDGTAGFVDSDSVIANPVARAVILLPAIVYETPTVVSRNKQSVAPPVLAYVTETRDREWARIEPLNARPVYFLTNTPGVIPPVQYQWVSWNDLSTNQPDVDLVIALQLSVKKYNEAKKIYESGPDEKNRKIFNDTVLPEVENLKKILGRFPQTHPAVVGMIREFLDVAAPEGPVDTDNPEPEDSSVSPREEEL